VQGKNGEVISGPGGQRDHVAVTTGRRQAAELGKPRAQPGASLGTHQERARRVAEARPDRAIGHGELFGAF